jgi:amidohydrolase
MTPDVLTQLKTLRHALHQIPEVSGQEAQTAEVIAEFLNLRGPDRLLTGLGGHGVAAVFDSGVPGPAVMIRCELDGLPIPEHSDQPYRSTHAGRGHLCGHDGHMVMVAGLADWLASEPSKAGRVILLFQPAEETGQGAAAVLADPRFAELAPDYALSLHNLPGRPMGELSICASASNCASRGMRIGLTGRTSHAAAPQDGVSPAGAMSRLLPELAALGQGGDLTADYALVTLTHARMGEATFGIAPGEAEIWATLRTVTDARMNALRGEAETLVAEVASDEGLSVEIGFDDIFEACVNHPEAVAILSEAGRSMGRTVQMLHGPMRFSEDFGQFGKVAKSAMLWLGAGEDSPQLHNPDYDFPDAVIPVGLGVFQAAIDAILTVEPGRNF